jgi:hypothetical protein
MTQHNPNMALSRDQQKSNGLSTKMGFYLVGGFNHLEKYSSMGRIIPYTMENKSHVPNHQPNDDLNVVQKMFPLWYHVVPWKSTMESKKCSKPPISYLLCLDPAGKNSLESPALRPHGNDAQTQTMRNAGGMTTPKLRSKRDSTNIRVVTPRYVMKFLQKNRAGFTFSNIIIGLRCILYIKL